MKLEDLTPFQLALMYYGEDIPKGIKLDKKQLIKMIHDKGIAKVVVESTKDTKWREKVQKEMKKNDHRTEEQKNAHKEGTFKKPAGDIERQLLKETKNDAGKASQKCNYYLNVNGKNAPNKHEVKKAMDNLHKKSEKKKEQSTLKVEANDIQLELQFVPLKGIDRGFQNYKYYYNNEFVQRPDLQKRFEDLFKKRFGNLGIINNQFSTSKESAISSEAETFFEDTFGRSPKTYIGDGIWGIWVSLIDLPGGQAGVLQFEEPKSPFSRILILSNPSKQLAIMNKLLQDWKAKMVPAPVQEQVIASVEDSKVSPVKENNSIIELEIGKMKTLSSVEKKISELKDDSKVQAKTKVIAGDDTKDFMMNVAGLGDQFRSPSIEKKVLSFVEDYTNDLAAGGESPCDATGSIDGVEELWDMCSSSSDLDEEYEASIKQVEQIQEIIDNLLSAINFFDKKLKPVLVKANRNMDRAKDALNKLYDERDKKFM